MTLGIPDTRASCSKASLEFVDARLLPSSRLSRDHASELMNHAQEHLLPAVLALPTLNGAMGERWRPLTHELQQIGAMV